jgi:hypothetical protein
MGEVEIAVGLTLYLSFGAFLFFPTVAAPAVFSRLAIGLCASEFVATIVWIIGGSSSDLARTAGSAATLQIPVLTGAMFVVAVAYGLHVARRW